MHKIPAKTLLVGQQIVSVPECHSTNDVLQQLINKKGLQDGLVVITARQTHGRGQQGTTWESEPGMNLTFSVAIAPYGVEAKDHFLISIAVSLGIFDFLAIRYAHKHAVRIKWPNDLMVNGRKICGILIENSISGSRIQYAIAGIGLNVNQTVFEAQNATSMAMIEGHEVNLQEALEELLFHLEKRYQQLRRNSMDVLKSDYQKNLFWMGEERKFSTANENLLGTITGIDDAGRLLIRTGNTARSFAHKEVSYG